MQSRLARTLLLISLAFAADPLLAQSNGAPTPLSNRSPTTKRKTKSAAKTSKPVVRTQADDTSAQVRGYQLTGVAMRGGYFIGGMFGYGIEYFSNYHPNLQFAATGMYGTHDIKDGMSTSSSTTTDKFLLSGSLAVLQARWFLTNSLAVGLGMGYRGINVAYEISEQSAAQANVKGSVNSQSCIIQTTLSSFWSWNSGLILGVDWLGVAYPIGSLATIETETTGTTAATTNDLQSESEDFATTLGQIYSAQYAVLSIGYGF